jgi:choline-sulfatase
MAKQKRGSEATSPGRAAKRAAPARSSAPHGPQRTRRPPLSILAIAATAVAVAVILAMVLRPHTRTDLPAKLAPGAASGYNVLLITLDTTRADHLGCYGYDAVETPALDGLARDGILFADAVCTTPITLPSHATMLTGLDPPNHGVRLNGQYMLSPEHETLAEVVRAAGYETAAFISAFVLESRFGLDQGFDHYDDNIGIAQSSAAGEVLNQRPAGDVTRAATTWLKQRKPGRPFFAWVHYYDPPCPYSPPPAFAMRYRERPYDGEIAYMDSEIARLLAALSARGYRDRTLVIAVGDHGEGLGEHGESTHERLIYESVMRIPLILACPGLFRGPVRVTDAVVSTTDLFPTLITLLGVKATRPSDGVSLLACREQAGRMVYLESLAPYLEDGWAPLFGLRGHVDKYILAPKAEYYDLTQDPRELNNLYAGASGSARAARDALVTELSARLARWPSIEGVQASAQEVDPETRHSLESLGYISVAAPRDQGAALPDPKDMMPVLQEVDRANALFRGGQLDPALTAIRKAAALSPRDSRVLLTMAKILIFKEQDDEAEHVLRRSIEFRPLPDACLMLAKILINHGRYAEAIPILDQGAQLDPLHGGIWIARGDMAGAQNDYVAAIAAYRKAEEVDPYRVALAARARIQQAQAQLGEGGAH